MGKNISDAPTGAVVKAKATGVKASELPSIEWIRKQYPEPGLVRRYAEAVEEAQSIMFQSLPALGMHARGFSQEALIRACEFVGSNPQDWTQHPDVMERRRQALAFDTEARSSADSEVGA